MVAVTLVMLVTEVIVPLLFFVALAPEWRRGVFSFASSVVVGGIVGAVVVFEFAVVGAIFSLPPTCFLLVELLVMSLPQTWEGVDG